jgi:hypothetical protein
MIFFDIGNLLSSEVPYANEAPSSKSSSGGEGSKLRGMIYEISTYLEKKAQEIATYQ